MKINRDADGNVLIEMDNPAEAHDLAGDLDDAAAEPGYDVVSELLSHDGSGITTLTVRVAS